MNDIHADVKRCTAQVVVSAAINETLTYANAKAFNEHASPWNEDRVAREFGADALDHFRAIRRHRNALTEIITKEGKDK